jgi:hypothetical protein
LPFAAFFLSLFFLFLAALACALLASFVSMLVDVACAPFFSVLVELARASSAPIGLPINVRLGCSAMKVDLALWNALAWALKVQLRGAWFL